MPRSSAGGGGGPALVSALATSSCAIIACSTATETGNAIHLRMSCSLVVGELVRRESGSSSSLSLHHLARWRDRAALAPLRAGAPLPRVTRHRPSRPTAESSFGPAE